MHGSPLFRWDNRDLWQTYDFSKYEVSEAYISIDYSHVYYFTDTGRCWDADRHNVRDRVDSLKPECQVHTTDELMDFLREPRENPIVVNTHPNRWAANLWTWGIGAALDNLTNLAKVFLVWQRNMLSLTGK
jgi:hypothetical protein